MATDDVPDRLLLTTAEVGERLGVSHYLIPARIRDGQLLGHRDGNRWLVHVDDLPDPPPPNTGPRPIIVRGDRDGWLPGSVTCGDRAPRRDLPPDPPLEEAPWRIIRPADPRPEDPSA